MALLIWNSAKPQIPYPWAGVFENSNLKKNDLYVQYMYKTRVHLFTVQCNQMSRDWTGYLGGFFCMISGISHCMHRHVQYPWTSSYIPWWTLGLNQIVRIDLYIRVIFASQSVFVIFHLNKLNMETGNVASINKVNVSHIKIL